MKETFFTELYYSSVFKMGIFSSKNAESSYEKKDIIFPNIEVSALFSNFLFFMK